MPDLLTLLQINEKLGKGFKIHKEKISHWPNSFSDWIYCFDSNSIQYSCNWSCADVPSKLLYIVLCNVCPHKTHIIIYIPSPLWHETSFTRWRAQLQSLQQLVTSILYLSFSLSLKAFTRSLHSSSTLHPLVHRNAYVPQRWQWEGPRDRVRTRDYVLKRS